MLYVLVSIIPQLPLKVSPEKGHFFNDSAKISPSLFENTINQQTTRRFEATELNLPSWNCPGLSCTNQCPQSTSTIFECGNNCEISGKELRGIQLLWRAQMKGADPPNFTFSPAYWKSPRAPIASFRVPKATHSHKYGDPFTFTKLLNSQSRTLWSCIIPSMLNLRHLPFSASTREAQISNRT